MPKALPEATDLPVADSEVIVVGKVELIPPLDAKYEQKTHWNVIGEKRMLAHVWLATGSEHKPITTSRLDAADFQASIEAEWGVPFKVKAARQRTWLNGGMAHLDVLDQERLWFPGGYYFDVPPGAKAVYIGTLRFHRNDFNAITRVEVVDERKDVAQIMRQGSPADVRTSLLKRIRPQ